MNNQAHDDERPFRIGGHDQLLEHSTHTKTNDELFIYTGRATEKPVDYLNDNFRRAVSMNIADIHFKKTSSRCITRFRMAGGALETVGIFPAEWFQYISDKIRSRAQLGMNESRTSQSGRLSLRIDGVNIDVRVEVSPAVNDGQLIVCRLLNQANSNKKLEDIEMTDAAREALTRLIEEPTGIFIVTGPTGSGKTTTLYALLNKLNKPSVNIVTIEDPVEYYVEDFHQIGVNDTMTFPIALRSVLRLDPDVIMVGEIRDYETASIAIQAAITGHLVLATMHANSAPLAITRLIDLGVDPMTLAAALRGVTAQRLVRTIAEDAEVETHTPNEAENLWLRANNIHRQNPEYKKVSDHLEGFGGVAPVMEIVLADHRVKAAFQHGELAIYEAASRQPQFETLAQASERLAYLGRTTLAEARKTTSVFEAPSITNKRLGQVLVESGIVDAVVMDKLLTQQSQARAEGNHKRLGQMLTEGEHCTPKEVMNAVGYTAEAQDILRRMCISEERRHELTLLVRRWTPGIESLFDLAIKSELVKPEDIAIENIY